MSVAHLVQPWPPAVARGGQGNPAWSLARAQAREGKGLAQDPQLSRDLPDEGITGLPSPGGRSLWSLSLAWPARPQKTLSR